jgi:replicative DNA helicase
MTNDDWSRLARKMGEVSSAPLFIDDSPNLTMMEIRAKARRLKQRHDLKLVVVDYLQLLSSGKKVESRQLEVSEFSRQMKLLAKELDVPIVAISQLNRGAEQRTDKRPLLSDLRESGCLTADTRLLRADTGAEISLGELLARNIRDIPVWTLDDRLKLVPRTLTHAFPSGVKETFRVRTASGRTVDATANHPFLTYDGWQPLGELAVGSRVGVLRHVPSPLATTSWDDDEVVLLAHLLGDGSFVRRQPMDLSGLRSHEKFVPDGVFGLPKHQVGLFLRHLWATDGSVRWDATAGQGRIHFESTSRRLVDAVARLLLRFNIVSRIKKATTAGYRDGWHLLICGADNQKRFCTEVGVHGLRGRRTQEVLLRLEKVTVNTDLDTVPVQVWDRVRTVLHDQQHAPSRSRLSKVATILDADLEVSATNDVFWDQIVEVEPLGERDVYDATVLGHHNFVANGIALHNSLEQDADMVILLHREDAYEKESTRPGEADLIVAKHRAGPTDTIVVAFQGHYSRFVDMQQS